MLPIMRNWDVQSVFETTMQIIARQVTRNSMTHGTHQTRAVSPTAQAIERTLTRGESALLLGAFLTLAASMASLITL